MSIPSNFCSFQKCVSTMIFIAKVRGLSTVSNVMTVSTNIFSSAWHHSTYPRVGFKRKIYHFLFSFPFSTVHCKLDCVLQTWLCAANFTVHYKLHCALQTQLRAANSTAWWKFHYTLQIQMHTTNSTARCKLHCTLQTHLCAANSTNTQTNSIFIIKFKCWSGFF